MIGILGTFAIFESYRMGGVSELMLQYVQWTGIFVLFLLLLGFLADENSRLAAAKNYMVEYLENVCIHRYAKMNQPKQAEEIAETEEPEIVEEQQEEEIAKAEPVEEEQKRNEQEMRIRAILEEFLA